MTIVNKANPTDAEIREEMASEFADYFAKPQRGAFLDECVKIASFLAKAEDYFVSATHGANGVNGTSDSGARAGSSALRSHNSSISKP